MRKQEGSSSSSDHQPFSWTENRSRGEPHTHHLLPPSFLLPGKSYGADDFLPVLMYVLARSNLTEMLLSVEYVMELMDPALQLGEGESPSRAHRPPPTPAYEGHTA